LPEFVETLALGYVEKREYPYKTPYCNKRGFKGIGHNVLGEVRILTLDDKPITLTPSPSISALPGKSAFLQSSGMQL
jgi:hypothetical protein